MGGPPSFVRNRHPPHPYPTGGYPPSPTDFWEGGPCPDPVYPPVDPPLFRSSVGGFWGVNDPGRGTPLSQRRQAPPSPKSP